MAKSTYRRGGQNIAVADGGTAADDAATARTNLDALGATAHNTLDHSGIPGTGTTNRQTYTIPKGIPSVQLVANPQVTTPADALVAGPGDLFTNHGGGPATPTAGADDGGQYVVLAPGAGDDLRFGSRQVGFRAEGRPRCVIKVSNVGISGSGNVDFGFDFGVFFRAEFGNANWLVQNVSGGLIDTGINHGAIQHLVVDYDAAGSVVLKILDEDFVELYSSNQVPSTAVGTIWPLVRSFSNGSVRFYGGRWSNG